MGFHNIWSFKKNDLNIFQKQLCLQITKIVNTAKSAAEIKI